MNHSRITQVIALCGGALLVAGCSSASDAEPAPTETVTETVTSTPSAEPADEATQSDPVTTDWLLGAMEQTMTVGAFRSTLVAADVDCPNETPEDSQTGDPYWLECGDPSETNLHTLRTPTSETPASEYFAPGIEEGKGVVSTEYLAVISSNQNQLDDAAKALSPLGPEMIEAEG